MAFLGLGQNRKAMVALDSAVKSLLLANQKLAAGDYQAALLAFHETLDFFGSEACGSLLQQGNITQQYWINKTTEAIFGKAQSSIALNRSRKAFEQAEHLLRDAFTIKPDFAEGHEFMAELAIECGYPENARFHLERLQAINPHHQRAQALLAAADFDNGEYEEAIKKFAQLPESATTVCYTARSYLRSGNTDAAIQTLERGNSRFGQHYECCYYLGCIYAHAGRFDDARRILGQMVRWIPRRPEPMLQLANAYLMSGWYEEAERFYKESLKLHPPDPTLAYYGLAMIAAQTETDEFNAHLESIYRFRSNSELLHCAWGVLHERAENNEEAARRYQLVSSDNHMAGAAKTRLGFLLYRNGDYEGAKQALQHANKARPGDYRILDLLGAAAALTGDNETAVKAWSKIYMPQNEKVALSLKKALLNLAVERLKKGKANAALTELRLFYRKTGDADLCGMLAALSFNCALDELKKDAPNLEKTRDLLNSGREITQNPKFLYGLALTDLLEDNYEAAAIKFRSVLAANSRNPGASYHLGLALFKIGDLQGAENSLRHGVAVSFNQPAKQLRLKMALAAVLVASARYAEALTTLKEILRGENSESLIALNAIDLKICCLVLSGNQQSAEQTAIIISTQGYVESAELLLVARDIAAGRDTTALAHLENLLYSSLTEDTARRGLRRKAQDALAQLAIKIAVTKIMEENLAEAEAISTRALFVIEESNAHRDTLFAFSKALAGKDHLKARMLAQQYASQTAAFVLEPGDFTPSDRFLPLVLPAKQKVPADILQTATFKAEDWDASPYPEPLIAFDR